MATTSKNGYEIRSDLLGLAKSLVEFNYQVQVQEYEYKIKKDGDQVVQEFKAPTLAATDIINIAKQFNEFNHLLLLFMIVNYLSTHFRNIYSLFITKNRHSIALMHSGDTLNLSACVDFRLC